MVAYVPLFFVAAASLQRNMNAVFAAPNFIGVRTVRFPVRHKHFVTTTIQMMCSSSSSCVGGWERARNSNLFALGSYNLAALGFQFSHSFSFFFRKHLLLSCPHAILIEITG